MKYKVGDRVKIKSLDRYNDNKNQLGRANCGSKSYTIEMCFFCGKILTIQAIGLDFYLMEEDSLGYEFTDEMIEGLVEEPILSAPNITEGVYIHEKDMKRTTEYILPDGYIFKDENGNIINATKIVLEKLVVPKFKKGDKIKDKNNRVWYVVSVGNRHFDISSVPYAQGYFVPMEDQDDYELSPDRELPKTFEECVSVIMREGGNRMSLELMNTFRKLIDARNAYWKIAGEEMGLGKPWKPNDSSGYCTYAILRHTGHIRKSRPCADSALFEFPTEEMRDAFYENFKELIEQCKELL